MRSGENAEDVSTGEAHTHKSRLERRGQRVTENTNNRPTVEGGV